VFSCRDTDLASGQTQVLTPYVQVSGPETFDRRGDDDVFILNIDLAHRLIPREVQDPGWGWTGGGRRQPTGQAAGRYYRRHDDSTVRSRVHLDLPPVLDFITRTQQNEP
jgi:hypothetical protein